MTHLCNEMLVTVVNGQLPGPTVEVTEGDSVTVHVINKSPYNLTIHWYLIITFFHSFFLRENQCRPANILCVSFVHFIFPYKRVCVLF